MVRALDAVGVDYAGHVHTLLDSLSEDQMDVLGEVLDLHPNLLNAQNNDGETLLYSAIFTGSVSKTEFLLERGADVSITSHERTPLETAEYATMNSVNYAVQFADTDPAEHTIWLNTAAAHTAIADLLRAHAGH